MGLTSIGWTAGRRGEPGYTFNPWRGCAKEHTGCTNCYAERDMGVSMQGIRWGEVWQGGDRVVRSDGGWREPLKWARDAAAAGERRRVFCASLGDVLEVPAFPPKSLREAEYNAAERLVNEARESLNKARERLWDLIWGTAQVCPECGPLAEAGHDYGCRRSPEDGPRAGLDWLLLTKRPEHWPLIPEHIRPFVWFGTSIADQRTADEWLPRLAEAQGFRLRFVSLEPMVGPVDLRRFLPHLDWVLVGGESGAEGVARDFDLEACLSVIEQCQAARVPVYTKQLGQRPVVDAGSPLAKHFEFKTRIPGGSRLRVQLNHRKGEDMTEWPEALRVREHPRAAP